MQYLQCQTSFQYLLAMAVTLPCVKRKQFYASNKTNPHLPHIDVASWSVAMCSGMMTKSRLSLVTPCDTLFISVNLVLQTCSGESDVPLFLTCSCASRLTLNMAFRVRTNVMQKEINSV